LTRIGCKRTDRACLLCPAISGVNLVGYRERVVDIEAEAGSPASVDALIAEETRAARCG
jgi:hypothetical protein